MRQVLAKRLRKILKKSKPEYTQREWRAFKRAYLRG